MAVLGAGVMEAVSPMWRQTRGVAVRMKDITNDALAKGFKSSSGYLG